MWSPGSPSREKVSNPGSQSFHRVGMQAGIRRRARRAIDVVQHDLPIHDSVVELAVVESHLLPDCTQLSGDGLGSGFHDAPELDHRMRRGCSPGDFPRSEEEPVPAQIPIAFALGGESLHHQIRVRPYAARDELRPREHSVVFGSNETTHPPRKCGFALLPPPRGYPMLTPAARIAVALHDDRAAVRASWLDEQTAISSLADIDGRSIEGQWILGRQPPIVGRNDG